MQPGQDSLHSASVGCGEDRRLWIGSQSPQEAEALLCHLGCRVVLGDQMRLFRDLVVLTYSIGGIAEELKSQPTLSFVYIERQVVVSPVASLNLVLAMQSPQRTTSPE